MGDIHRAHELICKIGADTRKDLADELRCMADRIDRGEMTTGCTGGYSSGVLYSYKHDPDMTHDLYFQKINEELRAEKAAAVS